MMMILEIYGNNYMHFFCNETKIQAHKAQMKHVESSLLLLSVRNFRGSGLRYDERLPCVVLLSSFIFSINKYP